MGIDGIDAEEEFVGDLLAFKSLGQQSKDFEFTIRKSIAYPEQFIVGIAKYRLVFADIVVEGVPVDLEIGNVCMDKKDEDRFVRDFTVKQVSLEKHANALSVGIIQKEWDGIK